MRKSFFGILIFFALVVSSISAGNAYGYIQADGGPILNQGIISKAVVYLSLAKQPTYLDVGIKIPVKVTSEGGATTKNYFLEDSGGRIIGAYAGKYKHPYGQRFYIKVLPEQINNATIYDKNGKFAGISMKLVNHDREALLYIGYQNGLWRAD